LTSLERATGFEPTVMVRQGSRLSGKDGGELDELAAQLAQLKAELAKLSTEPSHFEAAAAVAKAEEAAKKGTALEHSNI
jgi:hypothetical protein